MYLLKHPSGTYYIRICLPKSLRDFGFPFDVKSSLLTKDRSIAIERNCLLTLKLRQFLQSLTTETSLDVFKDAVLTIIDECRLHWGESDSKESTSDKTNKPKQKHYTLLSQGLTQFIASKQGECIRALTVKQLEQRISHFIAFHSDTPIAKINSSDGMRYRDQLLKEGRSTKTNKEYLSAVSQFFNWCALMKLTTSNPFQLIKMPQVIAPAPSEQRMRWPIESIEKLLHSEAYSKKGEEFHWITQLLLHTGMRPSEVCQLRVVDINLKTSVIKVTNQGEKQFVKNSSSLRSVPIHSYLVSSGFLDYVLKRAKQGYVQLFSFIPNSASVEWSKRYCKQLSCVQSTLGMKPRQRPTAYSFRHTFIDELKQRGHGEQYIAEIVGHTSSSVTFNRYGKRYNLDALAKVIETINYG
ncbi:tyrosine-type recombinase/integrase [Vibrio gallicus]|uniref:tyrosine-type recombinase/integrase n=1 Tax=Vibrio gallicus TaxID=190897 RepID=UPI0021C4BF41|nr:tyrosine-type recombinase/integrase [Vibrio gallicus]